MLVGDDDPSVTQTAENALCIKLADIWVLRKELVAFFERIDILIISNTQEKNKFILTRVFRKKIKAGIRTSSLLDSSCGEHPME